MSIPYSSILLLTLQSYHPSYSSLSSYPPPHMHTHHPLQVPAIVLSGILSTGPHSILVSSNALQVSSPFYCTVAGFRLISLLQRYVILLPLSALPVSITSLLVHSTTESEFLPGHQLGSANRLWQLNGTEDLAPSSYAQASTGTWTTLRSIYQGSAQLMSFLTCGDGASTIQSTLENTNSGALRGSRSLKTFTYSVLTSLHWAS